MAGVTDFQDQWLSMTVQSLESGLSIFENGRYKFKYREGFYQSQFRWLTFQGVVERVLPVDGTRLLLTDVHSIRRRCGSKYLSLLQSSAICLDYLPMMRC